jgi:hypothetical protein
VVNQFSKAPRAQLKQILSHFYNDDELQVAKDTLVSSTNAYTSVTLPRVIRRKGDNRAPAIAEDILDLFELLDEQKVLNKLPKFVAEDLLRVPTIPPQELDTYCLAKKVEQLEQKIKNIENITLDNRDKLESFGTSTDNAMTASAVGGNLQDTYSERIQTWTEVAGVHPSNTSTSDATSTKCSTVRFKRRKQAPSLMSARAPLPSEVEEAKGVGASADVKVARSQSSSIKNFGSNTPSTCKVKPGITLIKKAVFHIDNIDNETTIDTLKEFLKEHDINVLTCFVCKSWVKGEGAEFVQAFRLCIRAEDEFKIMCSTIWPQGVIVRKWQFKDNHDGSRN